MIPFALNNGLASFVRKDILVSSTGSNTKLYHEHLKGCRQKYSRGKFEISYGTGALTASTGRRLPMLPYLCKIDSCDIAVVVMTTTGPTAIRLESDDGAMRFRLARPRSIGEAGP